MDIKDVANLIGVVTGPTGLMIAVMVFFRDRSKVKILMNWDMIELAYGQSREKRYFTITICNIGRRPIYLNNVHMMDPINKGRAILLPESIQGVTLGEGSQPYMVRAEQKEILTFAPRWWQLRAIVTDAAGKKYYSDWPTKPTSWAKDIKAPFGIIAWNKTRNWIRQHCP